MGATSGRAFGVGLVVAVACLLDGCGVDGGETAVAPTAELSSPPAPSRREPVPVATPGPAVDAAVAGLQLCRDAAPFVTDVVGDAATAGGIDPVFHGVLLTYADEHRDTFGGLWIDREARGTVVLAFTDDPDLHRAELAGRAPAVTDVQAVVPPPAITDTRPIGQWGVPFDVVRVPSTEADLVAAVPTVMAGLRSAGLPVSSVGADIMRSRISITPPTAVTAGDLADIAAAIQPVVALETVCVDATVVDRVPVPVPAGTSLDVITLPDASGAYPPDTVVECDGIRFRLGQLSSPPSLDDIDPQLRAVLDGWLDGPEGGAWPRDGWLVLDEGPDAATFIRADGDGVAFVGAERGRNGWIWSGAGGGGTCDVRLVLPPGLGAVSWVPDPGYPAPDGTATELHLLVTEQACTGAASPGERLLGPQVVETDTAVRITFATIPLTGDQTCPSNPATPVTITLQRPLGDRQLRDGLVIAPITELVPG